MIWKHFKTLIPFSLSLSAVLPSPSAQSSCTRSATKVARGSAPTRKPDWFGYIFIFLLFSSFPSSAIPRGAPPPPPPIQIHSDTASFDSRAGVAIHRGAVLLSQGDHRLYADELLVKRDPRGKIQLVTARGRPARYTGLDPKDHTVLVGQADRILYQPEKMLLILEGNADFKHPPHAFRGPHLQYDFAKRVLTSPPTPKGRSVLILQPR